MHLSVCACLLCFCWQMCATESLSLFSSGNKSSENPLLSGAVLCMFASRDPFWCYTRSAVLTYVLEPLYLTSEHIDFKGFYIHDTHVPMMLLCFLLRALVYRESLNNPATRRRLTLGVFPFISQSQQRQPTLYDGQYLPWWWWVILAGGSHTGRLVWDSFLYSCPIQRQSDQTCSCIGDACLPRLKIIPFDTWLCFHFTLSRLSSQ